MFSLTKVNKVATMLPNKPQYPKTEVQKAPRRAHISNAIINALRDK